MKGPMPKLTLALITEFRDRTISAYNDQPLRFRLAGMDRDLTEGEKITLARLDACVLTLRALNPDLVNVDLLNSVFEKDSLFVQSFTSIFDD